MRHKWDYGSSTAWSARSRRCVRCWATGARFGPGSEPWHGTMPDGSRYHAAMSTPECPGTPWVRTEDEAGLRWLLLDREHHPRLVSRPLVRQFGRQHVEEMLKRTEAPPLPEVAWAELS